MNIASLYVQFAVVSIQQIFGVRVTVDSQEHEAYNKNIRNLCIFMITKLSLFHFS